jgi:hypothetical protein
MAGQYYRFDYARKSLAPLAFYRHHRRGEYIFALEPAVLTFPDATGEMYTPLPTEIGFWVVSLFLQSHPGFFVSSIVTF